MAGFLNNLSATKINDKIWRFDQPLRYYSESLGCTIEVKADPGYLFYCDFESVPRIPVVYAWLGRTDDEEGGLHDFGYRKDCPIKLTRRQWDALYLEAMLANGEKNLRLQKYSISKTQYTLKYANMKSKAYVKWFGVRVGGRGGFHKKSINWKPEDIA